MMSLTLDWMRVMRMMGTQTEAAMMIDEDRR